ncbi:MFS transporter [Agromyces seonyuensis]|uniref:MFS transporter n=1 Tax=Agromyces seonyuensis TaxID=2662446 RepID=A0A6I4P1B5_9MICO|nr:MFS transporter [Agromyces seonyuensis]MWB99322.1 MFS transporter [Agromyces seonyuensis]
MPTDTDSRAARSVRAHAAGFWTAAGAFAVALAFSTVPTPIYAFYQERDGFPTWVTTVIFAAYAVGVVVSLYFAGHVSDWLGRRRVFLAALAIEIVAAGMFLLWAEVPGLIVARFVSGVGIGALTATATAHISELRAVAKPDSTIAPVVASFANIGGLAMGPLIAGILVTYAPAPMFLPYVVFVLLLALAVVAVALLPETVRLESRPYRPQRIAVPAASRGTFWAAGAAAFAAFAVFGMFMALTPTVLVVAMGVDSHLAAGAVPFAVFMSAAIAQVLTVRRPLGRQLLLSLVLVAVGIAAMALAVLAGILWLFVLAGITAGAGVGVLFRSSLGVAGSLAPAGNRGEVLAGVFLIAYVGLAVPSLLIGVALVVAPLQPVLVVFAVLVLAVVGWAVPRMRARVEPG